MDKTNIVIGTTSINRPLLHNDIFPDWLTWITNLNKDKYKISWFINIDIIKELNVSYAETEENYKKIVNDLNCDVNLNFLKCENNCGNFLKACKRLATNIYSYVESLGNKDDTKIIWLEDDWKLDPSKTININDLIETYSGNMTTINLTYIRQNYVHALAPSIISYNLWKNLHYSVWINQEVNIDPEHCVGKYCLEKYGKYTHLTNITLVNREINDAFLAQRYVNEVNSYYSYTDNIYKIKESEKFVDKSQIIDKFKDRLTFIRITPTVCIDYGRKFMEERNLFKNKGVHNDNFYN